MNADVVVVGSYVQDLTWKCAAFPHPGETVVGTFVTGPGGKGSNQAIAAGRAGARTLFIGAVGNDAFAAEAKRFYKENGIDAHFAQKHSHATGTAGIVVSTQGQNEIVVALGANARLAKADVDARVLQRARVVVVQCESNLATTATVLKVARRAGVTTVLNPAPMRAEFDSAVLRNVSVLILNETEFVALVSRVKRSGRSDLTEAELAAMTPEEIHALCRTLQVSTVIVTLGERGCLVSSADGQNYIRALRVKVVDTTGAGDAFVGGFAAGLVKTEGDVIAAAHFATAVAALSVTTFGTAPSMPWEKDVLRFLKKRSI